jgi:hypothetical protein
MNDRHSIAVSLVCRLNDFQGSATVPKRKPRRASAQRLSPFEKFFSAPTQIFLQQAAVSVR